MVSMTSVIRESRVWPWGRDGSDGGGSVVPSVATSGSYLWMSSCWSRWSPRWSHVGLDGVPSGVWYMVYVQRNMGRVSRVGRRGIRVSAAGFHGGFIRRFVFIFGRNFPRREACRGPASPVVAAGVPEGPFQGRIRVARYGLSGSGLGTCRVLGFAPGGVHLLFRR